jgi:hypothetical protein
MGIRKEGLEKKSRNYQEGRNDNTRVTTSIAVRPPVRWKTQADEMEKPF